ncbi:MAG: SusC/RagA family TonB-linked outer membrane protein [Paludibacteraceae bacterium]|nr:SusC/RagA family TonB-linked outer membrane protein [Paludibacteraceae bacterium]
MMRNKTILLVLFAAFSLSMSAQITGTVLEASTDFPVIGASVVEVGTTNGVITDFDGNFVLNVVEGTQIQISYMGFAAQTLAAKDGMIVKLEEDTHVLQEVVAIGYGSQTKKEITGSVSSVKAEDFNKGAFNSPEGLLQGKVAGLTMSKDGGGDPTNRGFSVQIRGAGSLTGSTTPLYIIDGVPGASMNNINPNDIESMDVLKDGSAAAIYGTRANAGVIIITTKKGKEGKTQVEYNATVSTANTAGRINLYSPEEFVAAGGVNYGAKTDWYNEITRVPVSTEHNLALSGGMKNVDYRASINYKLNQGLAIKSQFQEIIARANVNQSALNNMLEFNYNVSYSHMNSSWVPHGAYQQAMKYNPTMPVYSNPTDPDYVKYGGYYQNFDKSGFSNPVAMIMQKTDDGVEQTFLGSIRATIKPVTGLRISAFGSYQFWNQSTGNYQPSNSVAGNGTKGVASKGNNFNTTRMFEATAQYTNEINNHAFTILAGYAYQDFVSESFGASNTMFPTDDFLYNNLGLGEGLNNLTNGGSKDGIGISSWKEEWKLASAFGRINYNYDQRYYINASIRAEGSSKFGANNRWGYFPSVSASWLITNENFMRGQDVVKELKLRAGYGVTGNMPGDCYPWIGRMNKNEDYAYFGTDKVATWSLATVPNPDLKWETKHEVNVGVDFAFLQGRLSGTLDYYNRTTRDLLYWYPVDASKYEAGSMLLNLGSLRNQGIELTLNGVAIERKNFVWNLGLTMAHNKNKVLSLGNDEFKFPDADKLRGGIGDGSVGWTSETFQILEVGQSVGNFYGYKYAGKDKDGNFYGYSKDGKIRKFSQLTNEDKVILGNALPIITWGLSSSMSFYNVDFSFNLRGAIGGKLLNTKRLAYGNQSSLASGNMIISPDNGTTPPKKMTDYYLESGTFAKLGDVTLGYTFKLNDDVKKYLTNARIYFTAQNLATISNYSGVDPETVNMSGLEPGIEGVEYYPIPRTFMLGVNLAF